MIKEEIIDKKIGIINEKSKWNYEWIKEDFGNTFGYTLRAKSDNDYVHSIITFQNIDLLYAYLSGKIDTMENGI